jgi:hypothetical protein
MEFVSLSHLYYSLVYQVMVIDILKIAKEKKLFLTELNGIWIKPRLKFT